MATALKGDARAEWRQHWPVVLAATAAMALSTMNTYSLGVFMQPLQHDYGWTRAQVSTGGAFAAIATLLLAPFLGLALDRFGPRRIAIFGVCVHCTLTALLSRTGPDIQSWNAVWTALALMNIFILPSIWTAGVASFFFAGRGLAFAVVLCGSGLASIVTPILSFQLIEHLGWRSAYVALAGIWAAVVIPLLLLFFTSKTDQGRRTSKAGPAARPAIAALRDLARPRFLQLALATLLIAGVVVTLAVTLVPLLTWKGLPRDQAAGAASLLGIASIAGRLTSGYLLDRVAGRYLAVAAVSLPMLACAILLMAPVSMLTASAAVLIMGLALGAELDLVAYLASRYFKLENFGLLFGALTGVTTFAAGFGPLAVNTIFDATQSYALALWLAIPACATAGALFLFLGPYPDFAAQAAMAATVPNEGDLG